ncbi:MAG: hypothetical protein M3R62_02250, partial [Acidobacteriota bacterium]|nr:hypothetical protein [Acidobacteriota bacterium]
MVRSDDSKNAGGFERSAGSRSKKKAPAPPGLECDAGKSVGLLRASGRVALPAVDRFAIRRVERN